MSEEPITREQYATVLPIPTRWADNDIYGHVNNVEYFAFFDTVINHWLIHEGGLDIHRGEVIGLCAESHCTYTGRAEFPGRRRCRAPGRPPRRSSVRYELALFRVGTPGAGGHGLVRPRVRRSRVAAAGRDPARLRDALVRLRMPEPLG